MTITEEIDALEERLNNLNLGTWKIGDEEMKLHAAIGSTRLKDGEPVSFGKNTISAEAFIATLRACVQNNVPVKLMK